MHPILFWNTICVIYNQWFHSDSDLMFKQTVCYLAQILVRILHLCAGREKNHLAAYQGINICRQISVLTSARFILS